MKKMFIDIDYGFTPKFGQIVCGDVFLSEKIKNENRLIAVLSDGLGSGIKANILANMTATMALNFTINDQPIERSAASIRDTLPVDPQRKIAFASFTIVDTEFDGQTRIIEYGNPQFLVFRKDKLLTIDHQFLADGEVSITEFQTQIEDRIVLFSDGVSQSGIGRKDMPFGWETDQMGGVISQIIEKDSGISAYELRKRIIGQSILNDIGKPSDDITCAVLYFRNPRKLLVCTGPPYSKNKDEEMAATIRDFEGRTVLCGGTTALIVAREWGEEIEVDMKHFTSDIPPISYIKGVSLVTEGILTLCKAAELLKHGNYEDVDRHDPARLVIQELLSHDHIDFLVGTKINEAHQDPSLPVELEIRRNVIKKIAYLLEKKYLKEATLKYI
ncbi:MAG: SpoIIE family protein phosphatase [Salinivirgaceae bacterium]|nr:SpoIIE family protein phosphatase [Salinivirgaceae bacterium]MDY0281694.1 SpoIIE family protein phosphatase [Salinivirgaceae bacterium]